MSLCVIVNPAAARGRSRRRWLRIRQRLDPQADIRESCKPGHAEELARQAAKTGYDTIVAAGGDGTVHEVVNGLLQAGPTGAALGVIPLGSGNDYAASLHLPKNEEDLCSALLTGTTQPVDVGIVEDDRGRTRYFVNTLGMGLSGAVVWEIRNMHRLRGMLLYAVGAVRAILRHFQPAETTLTLDGKRRETATLSLTLAIGRREGGGFVVAPSAKIDDGLFDYLHASRLTRFQALRYLPRLALGRLPNDPAVTQGQCRLLEVISQSPLIVHVDGELFAGPDDETKSLRAQIQPHRLQVRGRSLDAEKG